jgi:hypothetical protein
MKPCPRTLLPIAVAVGLACLAPVQAQDEPSSSDGKSELQLRHRPNERHTGKGEPFQQQPGFRGGEGNRRIPTLEMLSGQLPAEEIEELHRLQREDPQAFRQKFHDLVRRFRQERGESQKKMRELQKAYQKAPDDEARNAIRTEIATAVKAEFEEQMKCAQQRLEQSRTRLAEIEKKFADQETNAERIIAERVQALTNPPSDSPPPPPPPDGE